MIHEIKEIILSIEFENNEPNNENQEVTEVIVRLNNQALYTASFFSYASVSNLERQHQQNGNFLNGRFLWASNLILVKDFNRKSIEQIIHHLMEEGIFTFVFKHL